MNGKFYAGVLALLLAGCCAAPERAPLDPDAQLAASARQYRALTRMLDGAERFPQTYDYNMDRLRTSDSKWWCSGFYPGTLFYLYEATGDRALLTEGERMLGVLAPEQFNTTTHDVGFMIGCSFGNADRIDPKPRYREALINGARSLMTRFNPVVGSIKSHNREDFIVIIDNMMNLELLFRATQLTGDSTFYHTAVRHAETTLRNHFRPDNSVYHALVYDPQTGGILQYQGGQGLDAASAWSRGQAWAVYGFTMAYRFTRDERFLDRAVRTADFYVNHPALPADGVPYWDFKAPHIPHAERDASAAAITASGLLELTLYCDADRRADYLGAARTMLRSLSSSGYFAAEGTNGGFLLGHCVGNIPAGKEVDAPLSYADYYYVEALLRLKALEKQE